MNQITNREWAWLILVAAAVIGLMITPSVRRRVIPSLRSLANALQSWAIVRLLVFYVAYVLVLVTVASRLHIWTVDQLKDTVVVTGAVGLPILLTVHKLDSAGGVFRRVLISALGASAFLAFYVQLETLDLWAEVLVQGAVAILILISFAAQVLPKFARTRRVVLAARIAIGLALFAYTTDVIATTWDASDWSEAGWSLALSVWLPLALLPFLYVSAFFVTASSALTMALFRNGQAQHKSRTRLAGYCGLRFSLKLAHEFIGDWRWALGDTEGFRDGLRVMKRFRQAVKKRDHDLRAYTKHMEETDGSSGFDQEGLVLDRREFHVTKERLDDIYWLQRGTYSNGPRRYDSSLLEAPWDWHQKDLPVDNGLTLTVSDNGQSWMAWRLTPSGWCFGMGGTSQWQQEWQFDGPNPPSGFPGAESEGWKEVFQWEDLENDPRSPEWRKDDEPPIVASAYENADDS